MKLQKTVILKLLNHNKKNLSKNKIKNTRYEKIL